MAPCSPDPRFRWSVSGGQVPNYLATSPGAQALRPVGLDASWCLEAQSLKNTDPVLVADGCTTDRISWLWNFDASGAVKNAKDDTKCECAAISACSVSGADCCTLVSPASAVHRLPYNAFRCCVEGTS